MSERLRNCYDKEKEEELKYANVTSPATNNLKDQREGGKEEDVYEEPEGFADLCQNLKMNKVKEMDFRKEDQSEEETSEDDDYENVTTAVSEATVDIYGDEENIYQNF